MSLFDYGVTAGQPSSAVFDAFAGNGTHPDAFAEVMYSINAKTAVCGALAKDALLQVLQGEADPSRDAKLGALLMGSTNIATPEMIVGFVDAVGEFEGRDFAAEKPTVSDADEMVVGCAGSGKKGRKTFNISTASMVVAAAAGGKTLKAGSHSASSLTGSSDILEAVGFTIPNTIEDSTTILDQTNFGFYSIEDMVPRFNEVYGNRFFAPHALSYALPALLIPVKVDTLLYGYAGPNIPLSAQALTNVGHTSVMVCNNTVDGVHYVDEMATVGTTQIVGTQDGAVGRTLQLDAADYLAIKDSQSVPSIDSHATLSAQTEFFLALLGGEVPNSIAENTICLNAATMLYLGRQCDNPKEGFALALETVRSGQASSKLHDVVEASRSLNG